MLLQLIYGLEGSSTVFPPPVVGSVIVVLLLSLHPSLQTGLHPSLHPPPKIPKQSSSRREEPPDFPPNIESFSSWVNSSNFFILSVNYTINPYSTSFSGFAPLVSMV